MSSNTDVKQSYTMRMCSEFSNDTKIMYSGAQVVEMITAFSANEFNKKKSDCGKIPFGKFKGRTVKDVASFDRQYLSWLIQQPMMAEKFIDLKNTIILALK